MSTTMTERSPLLDKYPAGSILVQEGADQETWVVSRDVLADLARDLRTKANALTRYLEPNYMRNLAKAHAANGEWPQALELGDMAFNRALELGQKGLRDSIGKEREDYRNKRVPADLFKPVVKPTPNPPATAAPAPAAAPATGPAAAPKTPPASGAAAKPAAP